MTTLIKGKPVPGRSAPAEMTVEEAAELLNVSPAYVLKLVDGGELQGEGTPMRLVLDDVIAYDKASYQRQVAGMVELMALTEELGLYDLCEDATK